MMRLTGRILSATAVALLSTSSIVAAESMDELIAAAKKEGQLTTIALPHDWCGYGAVLKGFTTVLKFKSKLKGFIDRVAEIVDVGAQVIVPMRGWGMQSPLIRNPLYTL